MSAEREYERTELDNIFSTGRFIGHEEAIHPHKFNEKGYDRYSVGFVIDDENISGEALVAIGNTGKRIFYDIVKIKRSTNEVIPPDIGGQDISASDNSISQNSDLSTENSKYSLKTSDAEKRVAELAEELDKIRDEWAKSGEFTSSRLPSETQTKKLTSSAHDAASEILKIFGLPFNNVRNMAKIIFRWFGVEWDK